MTAINSAKASSARDVLRDNPALHRDHQGRPISMAISPGIAAFICDQVQEGDRTIETGAGLSTLCFLAQGAFHTAIAPDPGLEPRLREYCREHGIRDERLTYIAQKSQDAVWAVEDQFQFVLIDGGHGFPLPFLDFYYLQRRLQPGGYLIIDDLEIWTGEILAKILSCEPAWKPVVQDGARSIVFQKLADWVDVDWVNQQFVAQNSLHPFYLQTVIPRKEPQGQIRARARAVPPASPASRPATVSLDYRPENGAVRLSSPAKNAPQNGSPTSTAADQLLQEANKRYLSGDLKVATALLREAQRIEPERGEILATLGSLHFQLGELNEARTAFEQAVRLTPANAMWHVQLAATCLQLQDTAGFVSSLQKSLALNPDCVEALELLANANLRRGSYHDAAKVYRKALTLKPRQTSFLLPLAKCLYHLGDRPGAQQVYQEVLLLEPGNALATEALQIIRNN